MTIEVFKHNENPLDLSYEDHVKNYWKFTCKIPKDKNPAINNNGEKDETANQTSSDPVFYLNSSDKGDELVERTCKVPAGKVVFIPFGVAVSEKEVSDPSVDNLKRIAQKDQDNVKDLSVKLDGVEVNNIRSYRTSTNEFQLEFPENALFNCSAGTCKAVADGFYLMIKPLSPGSHTVEIKGNLSHDEKEIDSDFSVNIKYTLNAQ